MSLVPNGKRICSVCNNDKITYECKGCSIDFCYNHLTEHRRKFTEDLIKVENDRDHFHENLVQQKENIPSHVVIQQITKWENDSIRKIKETAEQCRQIFIEQANYCYNQIETKSNKLNTEIIDIRDENEFNEVLLLQLRIALNTLIDELAQSPNITVHQDSSPYINKIFMTAPSGSELSLGTQRRVSTSGSLYTKYIQNGIPIAGGNGQGERINQLARPEGIFVDDDLTVYIADSINNRILKWKHGEKNGEIVAGGNGKGNRTDQFDGPTCVILDKNTNSLIISDLGNRRIIRWPCQNSSSGEVIISDIKCCSLAMDNNGNLYVADWRKHEVKRWKIGDKDGVIVAGGNGLGNNLNQLHCPNHIFIDNDYSVYVSDYANHRVVQWGKDAKEGIIVAGHRGQGNSPSQLCHPYGITVDQIGQIYVADGDNHRVMRWGRGDTHGIIVVGGKGLGEQLFQLNTPIGLALDQQGHLYVVDSGNHRVLKYQLVIK
ncbi:unnamed protein product [Rotaria magnacalcarata]|uniref:Uncharacterized protein n=1 Tax=Rotaria magnacalcarata TaxID=392030 RepID=A0A816W348_9BILA|nr:unnamed protein product [Rotaria magnacalcarata]CAF2156967.1 unnamed protein product [Rotaria magnacalcarata]CAF3903327.1 unnamed protein product [Rotaria magnacalcarata]CAF3917686.1 unnamed protein product [Rotaria magnacalcarata]